MILTIRKFTVNKDNDYEKMTSNVGQMRIFLEHILAGRVPKEDYPAERLVEYCRSLIEGQRAEEAGLADGSWSVSPSPSEVAEDDRVDYHFFPTYLALSLLVCCADRFEEVSKLPGLEKALERGFRFAVSGNLDGFGFNSLFQQVEGVLILGSGGCPAWLKAHPEACPELVKRLLELKNIFQSRLDTGDTTLAFGGDYKVQFELACKFLAPLEADS